MVFGASSLPFVERTGSHRLHWPYRLVSEFALPALLLRDKPFFVAVAGFGKAGFGLSQRSRACYRRPSEAGHFYIWRSHLYLEITPISGDHIHAWGLAPSFSGGILSISPGPFISTLLAGTLLVGTLRAWPGASGRQKHFGFPARIGNENRKREPETRTGNGNREPGLPLRKAPCQPLATLLPLSPQPHTNRWTKAKLSNALFTPTA